ncbi:hypothetical protein ACHAWF_013834 [Thalassiosira exigua]
MKEEEDPEARVGEGVGDCWYTCQIGPGHLADGSDPPPAPAGHRGFDPKRGRGASRDWPSRPV